MGKGILILESVNNELVRNIERYIESEYPHLLNHVEPINIVRLQIEYKEFKQIALDISNSINNNKYYAHFIFKDTMYVIYKNVIVKIKKGDTKMIRECQNIGIKKGIDINLLKFSEMFDKDHPND